MTDEQLEDVWQKEVAKGIIQELQKEPTVDEVVERYVKFRAKKNTMKANYESSVKKIDDDMKKLEAWLQAKMLDDGVKAYNTESGTAYTTTVEQATVSDMNQFLEYVKENSAWHLLEKRVSKTGVRELLDENKPVPPGVNWYVSTGVNIRKPSER